MRLRRAMKVVGWPKLLLLVLCGASPPSVVGHNHPIIAVLSVPTSMGEHCDTVTAESAGAGSGSCFEAMYVKWLESGGARVAPLRYDASKEDLDALLWSVNGVFFTGGDVDLSGASSDEAALYMETARRVFEHAVSTELPIWGTCMGFQTLSVLVGGIDVLEMYAFDSEDLSLALDLTPEARASRFLGRGAPADVVATLARRNVTSNLHHDGVAPDAFKASKPLADFYHVLSTNVDRAGKPFVSTIEGKTAPVFATQWHPERPLFEWDLYPNGTDRHSIDHSASSVAAMHYAAHFFVDVARSNNRTFPTPQLEVDALIYNYYPIGSDSVMSYYFPSSAVVVSSSSPR